MSKISVVIPTIWKGDFLGKLLESLESVNNIDEIILIDNSPTEINLDLSKYGKIIHKKMDENLFVNPSWNLGVKLSKNEIVCFLQDDILFETNFLEYITVDKETLIGVDRKNFPPHHVNYAPVLIDCPTREWGFGTVILFNKSDYTPIPDELKIWCGDDFLFSRFKSKKSIYGLPVQTKMSVTSDLSIFDDIKRNDEILFKKYI